MSIVGVSGNSLRVGDITGILKSTGGVLSSAAPGVDVSDGSDPEQEFAWMQSVVTHTYPMKIRWVMKERIGAANGSAGWTLSGCTGGVTMNTPAAAGAYSLIASHYGAFSASNVSPWVITPGTDAVWAVSIRLRLDTITAGDDARINLGFQQESSYYDCPSFGYRLGKTAGDANFCFWGADAVWYDTGKVLDHNIHTFRAYRTGGLTYLFMDNCAPANTPGVFEALNAGTANLFPARGAWLQGRCDAVLAKAQSMSCFHVLALVAGS